MLEITLKECSRNRWSASAEGCTAYADSQEHAIGMLAVHLAQRLGLKIVVVYADDVPASTPCMTSPDGRVWDRAGARIWFPDLPPG